MSEDELVSLATRSEGELADLIESDPRILADAADLLDDRIADDAGWITIFGVIAGVVAGLLVFALTVMSEMSAWVSGVTVLALSGALAASIVFMAKLQLATSELRRKRRRLKSVERRILAGGKVGAGSLYGK